MITIFPNFYTQTPFYQPIDSILERIKSGRSLQQVNKARECYGEPNAYSAAKKKLPCILFSGKFSARSIAAITQHSGFICLDFDKFPNEAELSLWRDNLEGDEYTYSVFLSPSGMGLKCVVKIPPYAEFHKAHFRGLQGYYDCPYFDPNVFDVSRICFESYDPNLQINKDSSLWVGKVFDAPANIERTNPSIDQQEAVRRLLKWWHKKYGVNAGSRNNNVFTLAAKFNDFGIDPDYARSVCGQFQADDFRITEIDNILKSAYKNKDKFGTCSF